MKTIRIIRAATLFIFCLCASSSESVAGGLFRRSDDDHYLDDRHRNEEQLEKQYIHTIDSLKNLMKKAKEASDFDALYKLSQVCDSVIQNRFMSEYDRTVTSVYDQAAVEERLAMVSRDKNRAWIFISVLILMILIPIVILSIRLIVVDRNLRRKNKELVKAKYFEEISMKNKSAVVSNMSHEIKTPLNSVVGFSQLLMMDEYNTDEEEVKRYQDIIKSNCDLLKNLMNDVIDFSNINLNDMTVSISNCDIVDLASSITSSFDKMKHTAVKFTFTSDTDSLFIDTDPVRIRQVLMNLISNAMKFCKDGTIAVDLRSGREVVISVTDDGPGVEPAKQEFLFGRFEKLNDTEIGTGLGLSICKIIVRKLGGKIWYDSHYISGARFIFTLPNIVKEEVR